MTSREKNNNHYLHNNHIQLIRGGKDYFSNLVLLINKAERFIQMQVYIYEEDTTGLLIANALINASKRGVKVLLMVDGYASQSLSNSFIILLRQAGIYFRFFEPLFRSRHFYFGRRMHQKLIVIDGYSTIVGGVNIADRYNDINGIPAWMDYALQIEGEVALQLHKICLNYWKTETLFKDPVQITDFLLKPPKNKHYSVRLRQNDWVKGKHQIWRTYFNLFNQAEQSITIMCSYFLPGYVLRRQLNKASQRGVKIKVILAGPSDVMLAKYAERYLYDWMFRNNIEIYEYQPSVLHAKLAIADNHWMTIGSFNVNNISAYASSEINVDVRDRSFVTSVNRILEEIIKKDCIRMTKKNFSPNATLFRRFLQKSSYEIIRLVLNLSTFYFKHEN
jgi:cardiolipin synthase A/B